ncbi:hypothetical protein HG536_0H00790 [Torulaspora globosa]|uniref:inorganic diphosphatase n=1 Tax=Torulaspora globosa TaxID=48254 RepID=A0A7G3ZMG8_9SACH|nr:uncharacterized protein HG536_0H00790 [Torulaspora globosa]QLL34704.1 hypothetical protein HG536_0H00790 [Torulaspora globosa]
MSKISLARIAQLKRVLISTRKFHSVERGSKYSASYRNYLKLANGEIGSYFHDVPLELDANNRTANMVVEVPRWSNAKFEISGKLEFNPIVQDTKKGKVRFVHNIFPYHGYIHNYGALPQTWEDPSRASVDGLKGDNDPLDCCEIGSKILTTGTIQKVKILGSLALIDDGELDWKVIAISVDDPLANEIEGLDDVERKLPGILDATREWFRNYKIPAGKPANSFAFDEEYRGIDDTIATIKVCGGAWQTLIDGTLLAQEDDCQVTRAGKGITMKPDLKPPHEIPSEVNKWSFLYRDLPGQ